MIFAAILSLIFAAIGFVITPSNARYLLAGYNTMSEKERAEVDIASVVGFFRKFHLFLGFSVFAGFLVLNYIHENAAGVFLIAWPLFAYAFLVTAVNIRQKKSVKITSYFISGILILLAAGISLMASKSLQDNRIVISDEWLTVTGDYGGKINVAEIRDVQVVNELPALKAKVRGFALGTVKKGKFKTETGETVKLFLNTASRPFLRIITSSEEIWFSSSEQSVQTVMEQLQEKIPAYQDSSSVQ
jgi:hypothetical protein